MKHASPITPEMISRFRASYDGDPANRVLTAALSKHELQEVAYSPADGAKLPQIFTIEVKTHDITDQKHSGRCWLFASMNLLRERIIKKCNLESFELSGNYFAFWDKFEKINYFLESVIDTADLPVGDRTFDWLMWGPGDGGQWDMMVSIAEKYGIVPYSVMPETFQSSNTRTLMNLLCTRLRKCAIELREMVNHGEDPAGRKEEMLQEFFKALCIAFGKPVETFDFEYRDKDGNYHVERDLTPLEFYRKYADGNLKDYVSVIHAPTKDKPFGKTYTVKYLGNVIGGSIRYLNLPMEEMKALTLDMLRSGEPVWFGSDCGKYGSRKDGLWDPDSFVYDGLLGMDLSMTKAERLDYHDSAMNHAMLICGVALDENGRPTRWKIENSWGEESGRKGYYCASDRWFDEFTYQVIIRKDFLKPEYRQLLEEAPIELEPWDPMGTLA